MPTAIATSTTSRRALAGTFAAITAGLAAPAIAHAASPIAETFRQFEAARAEADAAEAKAATVRAQLIAKHKSGLASAWRGDPRAARLAALNRVADAATDRAAALWDRVMALPAASIQDVHLKIRAAAWNQPTVMEGLDWHEARTIECLREAARVLAGAA